MKRTPTYMLRVRMRPDERARIRRVADRYGLTVSSLIRMLVKREDEAQTTGSK